MSVGEWVTSLSSCTSSGDGFSSSSTSSGNGFSNFWNCLKLKHLKFILFINRLVSPVISRILTVVF